MGTKNSYKELRDKHQNEFNAFPMAFAFNQEQFEEGMRKLGLEPGDKDKVYALPGTGGFIRRSDKNALRDMLDRHIRELKEAMKDEQFIFEAFSYELGNHEYVITGDVSDAIAALGLTMDEVNNDPMLSAGLQKAAKTQREWYTLCG